VNGFAYIINGDKGILRLRNGALLGKSRKTIVQDIASVDPDNDAAEIQSYIEHIRVYKSNHRLRNMIIELQ